MRNERSARSVFPRDPVEVRRFKAIHGLGDALFESVRQDLHVWQFGSAEYVSEREALAEIGRRATVRGPQSCRRRPGA
jgi:hypothetical protein